MHQHCKNTNWTIIAFEVCQVRLIFCCSAAGIYIDWPNSKEAKASCFQSTEPCLKEGLCLAKTHHGSVSSIFGRVGPQWALCATHHCKLERPGDRSLTEHAEDDERNWRGCRVFSLAVVFKKQPKNRLTTKKHAFSTKLAFSSPWLASAQDLFRLLGDSASHGMKGVLNG